MSYLLWRGFLICIVLGMFQWGYTHPDSELTIKAKEYWAQAKAEISKQF